VTSHGVNVSAGLDHARRSAACRGAVLATELRAHCTRCGWELTDGIAALMVLQAIGVAIGQAIEQWRAVDRLAFELRPTAHRLLREGWWLAPALVECPEHGPFPHPAVAAVISRTSGRVRYREVMDRIAETVAAATTVNCGACDRVCFPIASWNRRWLLDAAESARKD
jgi:hypothetical protein